MVTSLFAKTVLAIGFNRGRALAQYYLTFPSVFDNSSFSSGSMWRNGPWSQRKSRAFVDVSSSALQN